MFRIAYTGTGWPNVWVTYPSLTPAIVCVSFGWQAMRRMSTVARSEKVDLESTLLLMTSVRQLSGATADVIRMHVITAVVARPREGHFFTGK